MTRPRRDQTLDIWTCLGQSVRFPWCENCVLLRIRTNNYDLDTITGGRQALSK